jgi:hypothetical protein
MGNNAAAEPLYKEALAVQERVLGRDHPDYAMSLKGVLPTRGQRDRATA